MAKILKSKLRLDEPKSLNLGKLIVSGLKEHSKQVLLIDSDSDRKWTGAEIDLVVAKISHFLIDDCKLKKGGVSNTLSLKRAGRDIHDTALAMKCKFLFTTTKSLANIEPDIKDIQHELDIIIMDESECIKSSNTFRCKNIAKLLEKNDQIFSLDSRDIVNKIDIDPTSDFAVIQFSSGTTGKPKPIPRTHKNLSYLVQTTTHEEMINLKPGDIISGMLSLNYRPGLWALLSSVVCGSTFVICTDRTNVETLLKVIEKYRVTFVSFSLPFLSALGSTSKEVLAKYDTSSLRECITAGAKILNNDLPKKIVSMFNMKTFRQSFGMTESGLVFIIERSLAADNFLTVGHVSPGMEAKIVDRETGKLLKSGERGEVAIKGPQIFPGYLGANGVLVRADFDDDGFFRIGDQGYYDENGLVFIEGRYKELLTFQTIDSRYFPSDVEAIILEIDGIEDACVIKIGQVCKDFCYDIARAYITVRDGAKICEEDVLNFMKSRAPSIFLDGGVLIVDSFPKLPNGKIDKKGLSELKK